MLKSFMSGRSSGALQFKDPPVPPVVIIIVTYAGLESFAMARPKSAKHALPMSETRILTCDQSDANKDEQNRILTPLRSACTIF